jgi:signal transduction histidine kinase
MRRWSPPSCPAPLAVSFWIGWALTALIGAVEPRAHAPTVAIVLAVLLGSWLVLPWEPAHGWRRALPGVFFLAVLSLAIIGAGATYLPLLLAALANLTFSLGRTTAIAVAVAELLLMFLLVILGRASAPNATALLGDAVSMGVLSLFAIAMADAVIQARDRRAEAVALNAQVEELTITDERARMARDMHDSLGQSLTAVKLSIDAASRLDARGESARARDEMARAGGMVVDALTDTRRWVRALRPIALDGGMGPQALSDLADSFRGAGIHIRHRVSGEVARMSPRTQLVAYRVVQESLANAVRYSRALTVTIDLDVGDGSVAVAVADDGAGIAEDALVVAGGFGLAALSQRVEAAGGTFAAAAGPGGGFEVRAELPL